ncbi:hypothetical protein HRbin39_01193 [bacterium HR39]|nr:hypothetical protein HRbin39_01193 [bacterium HR39]
MQAVVAGGEIGGGGRSVETAQDAVDGQHLHHRHGRHPPGSEQQRHRRLRHQRDADPERQGHEQQGRNRVAIAAPQRRRIPAQPRIAGKDRTGGGAGDLGGGQRGHLVGQLVEAQRMGAGELADHERIEAIAQEDQRVVGEDPAGDGEELAPARQIGPRPVGREQVAAEEHAEPAREDARHQRPVGAPPEGADQRHREGGGLRPELPVELAREVEPQAEVHRTDVLRRLQQREQRHPPHERLQPRLGEEPGEQGRSRHQQGGREHPAQQREGPGGVVVAPVAAAAGDQRVVGAEVAGDLEDGGDGGGERHQPEVPGGEQSCQQQGAEDAERAHGEAQRHHPGGTGRHPPADLRGRALAPCAFVFRHCASLRVAAPRGARRPFLVASSAAAGKSAPAPTRTGRARSVPGRRPFPRSAAVQHS